MKAQVNLLSSEQILVLRQFQYLTSCQNRMLFAPQTAFLSLFFFWATIGDLDLSEGDGTELRVKRSETRGERESDSSRCESRTIFVY